MGKKRKNKRNKSSDKAAFQANPFSDLKGFAVSTPAPEPLPEPDAVSVAEAEPVDDELFAREMSQLGVKKVDQGAPGEKLPSPPVTGQNPETLSEEEEFLAAMGELQVPSKDELPEENGTKQANPRRMKLLKQGRLKPEATLDLHGLFRHQVADKVSFFLQDARYQGYRTLLIITGRGLHSDGEPVLRNEVERFLQEDAKSLLAEWARAPRQYGGDGALIVFLKG